MKHLLLIGDGMADIPIDALGGKTPLEAAATPATDALCAMGRVGRVKTVPDGFAVGSDTAILSIFGCSPGTYYTGRAPLEAAGMGLDAAPGEAVFRANLISLAEGGFEDGVIISHSGGGIQTREARPMLTDLSADRAFAGLMARTGMRLGVGDAFRHIAFFAGRDPRGVHTLPPHDILGQPAAGHMPTGWDGLLAGIMRASHAYLDGHPINAARRERGQHPANGLWFWGEGTASRLPDFAGRYGAGGTVATAVPLVRGIARLCGLSAPEIPGADGGLDTDYGAKVAAALVSLETDDFAAIHYEAPDECAHAGDLAGKVEGIARFDARIVAPAIAGLRAMRVPWRVLILPDHPTPISLRTHDGHFVPYVLAGAGIGPAGIPRMTERHTGGLRPIDPGERLIEALMAPNP